MKHLLAATAALCLYVATTPLYAQEYSPNRWKETSRINSESQNVNYTDTVFLNTTDRNTIDLVIGGYAYRGTVEGDSLNVKKRTFLVAKNEEEEIRLRFGKLTHVFTRELKGTAGADAAAFAARNTIPENPVKKINGKQLQGTWLVYKKVIRDGAEADISKLQHQYLRKLDIFRKPQKGSKGNVVTVSNLVFQVTSIKNSELGILTTLHQDKSLKVLKQSTTELLIEDENHVIYFFKKY